MFNYVVKNAAKKIVWVARGENKKVSRIFKSSKLAFAGCENPEAVFKAEAVGEIRRQVYDRQDGQCLWCGARATYDGDLFSRMHMDEIKSKGLGGEVSLENCRCLCPKCHLQDRHGNRRPRFGE